MLITVRYKFFTIKKKMEKKTNYKKVLQKPRRIHTTSICMHTHFYHQETENEQGN